MAEEEPWTTAEYAINTAKVRRARDVGAFESDEAENTKRKKKTDFELEGHAE